MNRLRRILETRRAHNSKGEAAFISKFLMPYEPTTLCDPQGVALAFVLDVVDSAGEVPPVMFCAHIDTCHRGNDEVLTQELIHDTDIDMMFCADGALDCLGADDGAGVWLLMEMIDARVPGTYAFFRGEERGGIGSKGVVTHHTEWAKKFKWAIALDRGGADSVITEQAGGVCCSDTFALELAARLNAGSNFLRLAPDPTGVFTDTAEFTHLVPEATNLSVGYTSQHGPREDLDLFFLRELRDALVAAFGDGIDLPVERKPEPRFSYRRFSNLSFMADYQPTWISPYRDGAANAEIGADEILDMSFKEVAAYVLKTPVDDVADLLLALAEEVNELRYENAKVEDLKDEALIRQACFDSEGLGITYDSNGLETEFDIEDRVPF